MAVLLEYTSILVPVRLIEEKCGADLWEELRLTLGHTRWQDGLLFRDGAMNPYDIDGMLEDWQREGLTLYAGSGENQSWCDLAVVDCFTGPTRPCPWLAFDADEHSAWLKDRPKGRLAGPKGRRIDDEATLFDPRKFRRSTLGEDDA